jgi:aryl-alcohol dehydrogenase-like predicted oxidoreductase
VPAIGFGAMVLSPGMYGAVDDDRAQRALSAALDAGSTFVDTSDGYGAEGHNERLVGRAVRGRRDEVVLATKFGFRIPEGAEQHPFPVGYGFGELAVNATRAWCVATPSRACASWAPTASTCTTRTSPTRRCRWPTRSERSPSSIQDGLVRHLGLSNVTAAQLREAHAGPPGRGRAGRVVDVAPGRSRPARRARELGVGLVAWSPLGGGFLTGAVTSVGADDFRQHAPRFAAGNLERNNDRYAPVRLLAHELGLEPGQLALAWLLAQDRPWCPSPAAGRRRTSSRTSSRPASCCTATPWPGWTSARAFRPEGGTLL